MFPTMGVPPDHGSGSAFTMQTPLKGPGVIPSS